MLRETSSSLLLKLSLPSAVKRDGEKLVGVMVKSVPFVFAFTGFYNLQEGKYNFFIGSFVAVEAEESSREMFFYISCCLKVHFVPVEKKKYKEVFILLTFSGFSGSSLFVAEGACGKSILTLFCNCLCCI